MKYMITAFLLCFTLTQSISQPQHKVSTYLFGQYGQTLYDRTKNNNLRSLGLGLQTFFNTKTLFRPSIELTGDFIYLDDKVLRTNADDSEIKSVTSMVTLFAGTAFHPAKNIYFSVLAGPGFVSGRFLPGIKPSLGFYFDKNQKASAKISYINIFNRYQRTGKDYGLLSFAFGFKLF